MEKGGKKQGFAKDRKLARKAGAKGGAAKVRKGFATDPDSANLARLKGLETRRKNREAKLKQLQDELRGGPDRTVQG